MIKAVIFDCFGVLTVDLWKEFVEAQPEGVDVTRLTQLNGQLDAGFLSLSDFTEQVRGLTGSQPSQIEDILSSSEAIKNTKLYDVIKGLKSSNYKIGMISNVSSNWIRDIFLSDEEQALFDDMVFSFEVGLTKPDTRIYELSCDRLGVGPSSTIFVDDSIINCEGAEEVGMYSINYRNFSEFVTDLSKIVNRNTK